MKKNEILNIFSASTTENTVVSSELQSVNNYLVYSSSIGGNIVNEFNVRQFLDDQSNENVTIKFFDFLKNTFRSTEELHNVFYNNQKLSDVFNDYYNQNIRDNTQKPKNLVVKSQFINSSAITITNLNFTGDTHRSMEKTTVLMDFSSEPSFYLPVSIQKSYNEVLSPNTEMYDNDIISEK